MAITSRFLFATAILAATATSCGDRSENARPALPSSTLGEPADQSGSPADPQLGSDLPISFLETNVERPFTTLESIADASAAIVVGAVTSVDSIGVEDSGLAPFASEYFLVTVEPEQVVKGEVVGSVSFIWNGFVTEPEGFQPPLDTAQAAPGYDRSAPRIRTLRTVADGVSMPDPGDRLLTFLSPPEPESPTSSDARPTHGLTGTDGIFYVDDGLLVTQFIGDKARVALQLNGRPLEEVTARLAQL